MTIRFIIVCSQNPIIILIIQLHLKYLDFIPIKVRLNFYDLK